MDLLKVFGACGERDMFWLLARKFRIYCFEGDRLCVGN
jgi:hypothetical protein